MNAIPPEASLSEGIAVELPYLRRYARALTGAQKSGDDLAVAALAAILDDRSVFVSGMQVKVGLFHVFHRIWSGAQAAGWGAQDNNTPAAEAHLARLRPNSREALLLHTIEEFSVDEVATIMALDRANVQQLLTIAHKDIAISVRGRVLVIEDEPVIAADIKAIVEGAGHEVTAIARTRADAIRLGVDPVPDLLLVDIQLADNSSGIDAVNELLAIIGPVPVIFITAFPEMLLTGDKSEPAFMISKPYREGQVTAAVSQAMFFASTKGLCVV